MKRNTKKILNESLKGEMFQIKMPFKKEKRYLDFIEDTGMGEAIKKVHHKRTYTIIEALKML